MRDFFYMEIYRIEDAKKTKWTGGTTTELFIYPKESDFLTRNFSCRISTATIEVNETEFTPLPGFERKIMVLKGQLELEHIGHYTKKLNELDQDTFSGDWKTKSWGMVQDFNVIYRPSMDVNLESISLKKEEIYCSDVQHMQVVYVLIGSIQVGSKEVKAGETIVFNHMDRMHVTAQKKSIIIRVLLIE